MNKEVCVRIINIVLEFNQNVVAVWERLYVWTCT